MDERSSIVSPPPPPPSPPSSSGDSTRVLIFLHKAVKSELENLRRVATNAGESCADDRKSAVVEIRSRLEFLKSVYGYHCAAEDEIIFLALDGRVANIVCTYYLEHSSIESMFSFTFSCLDALSENQENSYQEFHELIFRIGSLCDSICQHMYKEEKQVFPLLMKEFSDDEQASLVWQYMCSVPVMLMEDLFPWLACLLSSDELLDLKHCVMRTVPQSISLQAVVTSWLEKTTQEPPDPGGFAECDMPSSLPDKPDNHKDMCKLYLSDSCSGKSCLLEQDLPTNINKSAFDGLLLWHAAIRSEIKEILDKLYVIRSKKFLKLTSVIVIINFLTDVLIFYSNALERVFYPSLEESSVLLLLPSFQSFSYKNEVQEIQQIICDANKSKLDNPRFVEMLCCKVEALVLATCEHMSFLETEVFPLICKKYNHETLQKLIARSLRMLPLGSLKCMAIWFSSRLPKNEVMPILNYLDQPGLPDKSFASLLHEWIRTGYSGKSTTEDLQEMFNSRVSYMSEQIMEGRDSWKKSKHIIGHSVGSSRSSPFSSLSKHFQPTGKPGILCYGGVNSFLFSSQESNIVHPSSGCLNEAVTINYPEAKPIDHIYYFHKAMKKDLDSLVLKTTKLPENMGLLVEFSQHFHLVQSLYELHSETEDEIAFPALEAKQVARNLTQSYSMDHKLEDECFNRVSRILDEMSELSRRVSGAFVDLKDPALMKYHQLCFKLQDSCKSLKKILNDHIYREEMELWPLFREYFTIEEQEKIIGYMLGRTRSENLQTMIVWLMNSLTSEEQHAMMNFWRKATRFTMFDEWLGEWWEGMNISASTKVAEDSDNTPSSATDSMEVISKYLSMSSVHDGEEIIDNKCVNVPCNNLKATTIIKMERLDEDNQKHKSSECIRFLSEKEEKGGREENLIDLEDENSQLSQLSHMIPHGNKLLVTSQSELEAAIRKVSQDSSLDLQEKSRVIQSLMTSHWVAAQKLLDEDNVITSEPGKFPGQYPSYRDIEGSVFGCKHYKQNCKLVAVCCNQLFTCRRCHDEVADHLMDRKAITQMMCMKCLEIQPIGPTCSTPSCNKYTIGKYYCKICRLFDNEREIYHCPYCNLCRVGKGLGIDYFHCMKCNACMSRSLSVHMCREKCFEDKCPICHEDIFTSSIPIKALSCGHMMHSTCFQDYTLTHYTCPVCSKSLGDMQVYFEMLDALLAEEKMPEEFSGQTQAILCNDCEKKGTASFHWLYHKCPFCSSYNTRLL